MRKLLKKILLLFILSLTFYSVNAQTTAKGVVVDISDNPLPGVNVFVEGTTTGTITDFDGKFLLSVPSGTTITVSFMGYKTTTAPASANMKITLEEDNQEIEEVVVVGYGQQKKASVVGSITQTNSKTLERNGGVSDLGSALTGNLPGVITSSSTGMPGDEDPTIVIRGVSSWNNSSPLILVDGIERPMSSVDISSVQSISVLKDASATAVYGVKGANGVILITTKRGQDGKAKVSAGYSSTMKFVSKLPEIVGSVKSLEVRNQAIENELGLSPDSWANITPQAIINKFDNPQGDDVYRYPDIDWQDWLFKDYAFSHNAYVNLAGGTKFVKYFAAIDYQNEGDLFKEYDNKKGYQAKYDYNRLNTRANLDFHLTKTTLLKANISGSFGTKTRPFGLDDNAWGASQLWGAVYTSAPNVFYPVYPDGTWGFYPADSQGNVNSALKLANGGSEKRVETRINTDFTLEQDLSKLLKGLKISGTISWDNLFKESGRGITEPNDGGNVITKWISPATGEVQYNRYDDPDTHFSYFPPISWSIRDGQVETWSTYRNLYYQGQIFYGNSFGKHSVSAMGVFNRNESASGSNFSEFREDWAFRVTYDYDNRYFFEYNGAYNGSEKFSNENRFAFFNSGAIGWAVSGEKFWAPIKKYMNQLKLRYSYGEIGDDGYRGGRWLYATEWSYNPNHAAIMSSSGVGGEPSIYKFYREVKVGNPDIHWEKAVKQNFGIDYGFLDGMISGALEFFTEHRDDIIIGGSDRAITSIIGASMPAANFGKTENKGYELELKVNHTFKNKLYAWANLNYTHATSKITEYDDTPLSPNYQKKEGFAVGQGSSHIDAGYAQTWDEVYGMTAHDKQDNQKLPGQYMIVDFNGDGLINADDQAPYGFTGTPQNTYSFSLGAEWKGWSIFAQFYGVSNVNRYIELTSLSKQRDCVYNEDYWTKDNQNAWFSMPRYYSTPEYTQGTRYSYDGSFVRLKNVELSYTFTQDWLKRAGLSSMKLYVSGNNLWLKTKLPDDRENNTAGTGLASQGAYPTLKRVTMGVKLEF